DAGNASLEITADNRFTVWLNGNQVGEGDEWKQLYKFDVTKFVTPGKNVLAVAAHNTDGPAGLVVRLNYGRKPRQGSVVSAASWKASKPAAAGWQKADFTETGWTAVHVIGPFGQAGPWSGIAQGGGGNPKARRFTVPDGFRVEQAVKTPESDANF